METQQETARWLPLGVSLRGSGVSLMGETGDISGPEATFLCAPEQQPVLSVGLGPTAHPGRGACLSGAPAPCGCRPVFLNERCLQACSHFRAKAHPSPALKCSLPPLMA